MRWIFGMLLVSVASGCATAQTSAPAPACTVLQAPRPLPVSIRETSGLAAGRRNGDVVWTHNDSGEPNLFALSSEGTVLAQVKVEGASMQDWEDIEPGSCDDGHCLYVADIGDNDAARADVVIYEIPEPALSTKTAVVRRTIRATYTDGAQDAEAFFRLPDGGMFVVTKGRHRDIALYRLVTEGNDRGVLQRVREIGPRPQNELDRVTAATASPDGKWVGIRTYRNLHVYRTDDLLGAGQPAARFTLAPLAEIQGEALTLDNEGRVWLSSEAEQENRVPTIAQVQCALN